ncbi:protein sidekick-2-like [Amphiura filiformis]|uniref:protein sidekick-2-like n=1 Tax=Amphiura filiformis TaxID=82378 RepID=UPI003B21D435
MINNIILLELTKLCNQHNIFTSVEFHIKFVEMSTQFHTVRTLAFGLSSRLTMPNLWILFLLCSAVHNLVNTANPPYITHQPSDMTSFEGNTIAISCDAIGDFPIYYKWTKNGNNQNEFETTGKTHLLSSIQKSDAGSYRCLVKNYIGTVMSRSAEVSVTYNEGFSGNSQTEVGFEGHALILTCNPIDSYPEPVITWTLDGIQIGNSQDKIMTLDNRLVVLDITNVDMGQYRCEADNPLTSQPHTSPTIMVFYQGGGDEAVVPEIVVPPSNLVIKERASIAEFECIVNGRPLSDIRITWRKDGTILSSGGPELFRYRILSPQESNEGIYECEASLGGRTVRSEASLTIYIPAEFLLSPEPITVSSVGSVVDMPCQATGNPRPTVTWYRNAINVEIITDQRYQVLASGSLQIQNLKASDAGMFQCLVANEVGEDIKDTWLQVQDGIEIATKETITDASRMSLEGGDLIFDHTITSDTGIYMCIADNGVGVANATVNLGVYVRTVITTKPQDTEVELGQMTTIDCIVQHDPLVQVVVKWYHDNVLVDTRADTRRNLLNTGSLEIKNARPTDSGMYICEVLSVAGGDTGSASLVIIELPYAPVQVRGVISTDVMRAIEVTWSAPFDGNTALLRYIIDQKENDGSWMEIESNLDPQVTRHVVTSVKPSRRYQYRVKAENRVGRGPDSDTSNAVHLPEEPPDDPPQGVVSSASSTTSIIVEWQKPPEDSWNGQLRGYVIRYKLDGYNQLHTEEVIDDIDRTSVTLGDLITWTRYEIQVSAYNGAGVGAYSDPVRVRTNEGVPSDAPQNVIAVAMNSTAIRFVWEAPHPQTVHGINQGYKLHAWEPLMEDQKREVIVPPDPTPGIQHEGYITGLGKHTDYLTSVLCFTNPGDGPSSQAKSVVTHEDIPGAVGNLKFSEVGDKSIRVEWQPPAFPNGILTAYEVGWQELNRSTTYVKQDRLPQQTGYKITGLAAETTYNIFVWAYTSVGRGQVSTATVKSGVPPEPPTAPTHVAVSNVQARSVTLQFRPGFDGYTSISLWITEALIGDSQQWQVINELSEANANSYEVPGLIPYTDYQFRIIALNVVNRSSPSEPSRKIQTLQDVPAVSPKEVTVRAYSETSLRVRWVPLLDSEWSGEPLGYHVFWMEAGSNMAETQRSLDDPNISEYVITGLEEWTKYAVRVQAYNERELGLLVVLLLRGLVIQVFPSSGPENLAAEPTGSSSIRVTWGQVPQRHRNGDILGFKILYQKVVTGSREEQMVIDIPGNESSATTLTDLRGYTEYHIKALAYTRIGDGVASSAVSTVTQESVPGPVHGINFPIVTLTSVDIRWQPPEQPNGIIEKYKVGFRQQQHPDEYEQEQEVGGLPSHAVYELTSDVSYVFRVTAKTRLGWGTPTSAVVITTNNRTFPQAPSRPVVDRVESRQVRISWNEGDIGNSPLRTYTIQVKKQDEMFTDHITDVKAGITSFTVDGLLPYTLYQFRLQAHNDVGTSPYSPSSNSISTLQAVPDGTPTIIEVTPVTTTSVVVKWEAPPEDTHNGPLLGHRILFRQLPDPGYMEQIINDKDVKENPIESLERYHNYEIKVAAYNAEGIGPFSRPVTVFVGEAIPSAPPTNVKAIGMSPSSLKVSWTPPSVDSQNGGLQGYKIVYWVAGDKSTERIKTFAESSNTVLLEGLVCWTQYSVQVKGFNAAGEGPLSTIVENRTEESEPGVVPSLTFSKIRMTSLIVHWIEPTMPCGPIQGYQVFYQLVKPINVVRYEKSNSEKATITVDLGGTALSYEVSKLAEKADYTFRIMAKTTDYGPYKEANVTTGPQIGAPDPPNELRLRKSKTNLILQWKRPVNQGHSSLTNYIIEFLEDGRDEWELLTDTVDADSVEYLISYGNLKASTSYQFRVMAENVKSISFPTAPSELYRTPMTGSYQGEEGEFYQQWWFLVILALVGLIIIILVTATLCMLGRSRLYVEKKVHKRIQPDEQLSVEDGGFATFEMNSTVTATAARRQARQDPYNRHNSYTRPPPRPSPGSIVYSEEEESKHYEDVHRRDLTDVAESSSLTEKSDLQSHSESQPVWVPRTLYHQRKDGREVKKIKNGPDKAPVMSSEYSKGSEMESDVEDQFPTEPHSFVNHYQFAYNTVMETTIKKDQRPIVIHDSESSMNNGGSVMLNGLANMPAGSRAPVHGFSSFV